MSTGAHTGEPPLAIVVLSFGPKATLKRAVASAQSQGEQAEVVVVHTGSGDPEPLTGGARLVRSPERRFAGGARNLGVQATGAAIVAFLADDCVAESGWAEERLRAHRAGAAAVSSALLCHRPQDPVALAAHLSLYVRRLPRTPADVALRYGCSYSRELLVRRGPFREDLESGEDTEFHDRLTPEERPCWAPRVHTVHFGAERLGDFLQQQHRRGQRMAQAWAALGRYDRRFVARNALERTRSTIRQAQAWVEPEQRGVLRTAAPLIALGSAAYAAGAATAKVTRP